MKKLLLFILLFVSLQVKATDIQGIVYGNTTWTRANSPYIITGNILIDSLAVLTIEPGVRIEISNGYKFYIDGELDAVGSVSEAITFTGQYGGYWPGLDFRKPRPSDTCHFSYCHFDHTVKAIGIKDRQLVLTNCVFEDVSKYGVYFDAGSSRIENCKFLRNEVALRIIGPGTIDISANEFVSNTSYTLYISGGGPGVNLSAGITNNLFTNNKMGAYVQDLNLSEMTGNIFLHNETGLTLEQGTKVTELNNNIFASNQNGMIIHKASGIAHNNTFKHNKTAVFVDQSNNALKFEYNCFDSSVEMHVKMRQTYDNMDLRNNYWGSNDSTVIRSKIYDFYNDFVQGFVQYMPFLKEPDASCKFNEIPSDTTKHTVINEAMVDISHIIASPNPFNTFLQIKIDGPHVVENIEVYNIVGEKIITIAGKGMKTFTMSTNNYPAGVYLYKVLMDNKQIYTGRMIKQ